MDSSSISMYFSIFSFRFGIRIDGLDMAKNSLGIYGFLVKMREKFSEGN